MSFQNYDSFQGQQPTEEGNAPGAGGAQQQQPQMGQPIESAAGQFQGQNMGAPGSAGADQQGGDSKTTLWYAFFSAVLPATGYGGYTESGGQGRYIWMRSFYQSES